MDKLAAGQLGLGRRAGFPYRPVGQVYEFWCTRAYYITIFFHYLPGEQAINVFAIGYTHYGTGGSP